MATRCYCTALRTVTRKVTALYDEALAPLGIGVAQFAILRTLQRVGPVSATALGELVDLDRSTVSRNIRVLERLKLVRLERSETDQRSRAIALTAKGTRALDDGAPLWDQAQDVLRARIGASAADTLLKVMTVL